MSSFLFPLSPPHALAEPASFSAESENEGGEVSAWVRHFSKRQTILFLFSWGEWSEPEGKKRELDCRSGGFWEMANVGGRSAGACVKGRELSRTSGRGAGGGGGGGGGGGRGPPNVLMCWFEKIRRFFSLIIVFSFIVCYNCLMIIVLKKILACISLFFFLMFLGVLLWFIIDIIYIYLYSLSPLTL